MHQMLGSYSSLQHSAIVARVSDSEATITCNASHSPFQTSPQSGTYWERIVKAALVIDAGKLSSFATFLQAFFLITCKDN